MYVSIVKSNYFHLGRKLDHGASCCSYRKSVPVSNTKLVQCEGLGDVACTKITTIYITLSKVPYPYFGSQQFVVNGCGALHRTRGKMKERLCWRSAVLVVGLMQHKSPEDIYETQTSRSNNHLCKLCCTD